MKIILSDSESESDKEEEPFQLEENVEEPAGAVRKQLLKEWNKLCSYWRK